MKKFLLFPMFVLLAFVSCKDKRSLQEEGLREAEESQEALVEQLEQSLNSEEGLSVDPESLERHQAAIDSAADKMGGKIGEAMKAISALDKDMPDVTRRLNESTARLVKMSDWSDLQEADNYQERREFFVEYKKFNLELIRRYEKRPADVKRVLNHVGLEGRERSEFEKGLFAQLAPQIEQITIIRECDTEFCDIAVRILDMFEESKEEWIWDAASEAPVFNSIEDAEIYNKEMERMVEIGNEQMEAQGKIVELLKQA